MKILPVFIRDKNNKAKGKKTESNRSARQASFADSLEDKVETEYENSVEMLLNDLKDAEKRLIDAQTMYDLAEYKKLVKKILEIVTGEGFETKTLQRRRSSNRADFFIVKKIDQKIKELALTLTSGNNKAFSIVKECEEIRGLIFDLLH